MSEHAGWGATGPSHRKVEAGAAVGIAVFGLVVIAGSLQVGIGWASDGPKSGFFPFYVGLSIVIASAINVVQALGYDRNTLFADWSQLRQVFSVVMPTAIYVLIIPWIGIYISSMVLISSFMIWFGRYRAIVAIGIAVVVMAATYLIFERWFLVPLPKGPVEDYFGL